jgi:hypothetical protein
MVKMPCLLARSFLLALSIATVMLGVVLAPDTAKADATQLCRSISSIVFAPTDVAFAPFIAAKDIHYGLSEWGDPLPLQIIAIFPGYAYLNAMQVGGATIRLIGGVFELPMGLFTLFREGAQGALNRSQDEAWALVTKEIGPCPIRIGTSYNSINL